MLTKLATGLAIVAFQFSANSLLAGAHTEHIVQPTDRMSVEKIETFFKLNLDSDKMIWLPLEQGITRLGLNIPRRGFERALEFHDGNSLFHLSSVTDFGFNLQQSKKFSIGLNLGSNGYLMEVKRDINNGLVGGLGVEYVDELNFAGFFDKSLVYNNTILSSRIGYGSDSTGYIGGQAVQLSVDEESELFSWTNFSIENDNRTFGFGKTWFDLQYGLDSTLLTRWDNQGWTGGFLLNKSQGEAKFAAGLVDFDKNFNLKSGFGSAELINASFFLKDMQNKLFSSRIRSKESRKTCFSFRFVCVQRWFCLHSSWRDVCSANPGPDRGPDRSPDPGPDPGLDPAPDLGPDPGPGPRHFLRKMIYFKNL